MLALVTALYAEAAPIIEHYRLKRDLSCTTHAVFTAEGVSLAISGIGKVRCAAATTLLMSRTAAAAGCVAANIGVAGSLREAPRGSLLLVNKIHDQGSRRCFYPDMLAAHDLKEASLITVDAPLRDRGKVQPAEDLADMEASGFFEAASLFLAPSRIVCLKVVSDLAQGEEIKRDAVGELVRNALPAIAAYLEKVVLLAGTAGSALSAEEAALLANLSAKCRFTASQRSLLGEKGIGFKLRGNDFCDALARFADTAPAPAGKEEARALFSRLSLLLDTPPS